MDRDIGRVQGLFQGLSIWGLADHAWLCAMQGSGELVV